MNLRLSLVFLLLSPYLPPSSAWGAQTRPGSIVPPSSAATPLILPLTLTPGAETPEGNFFEPQPADAAFGPTQSFEGIGAIEFGNFYPTKDLSSEAAPAREPSSFGLAERMSNETDSDKPNVSNPFIAQSSAFDGSQEGDGRASEAPEDPIHPRFEPPESTPWFPFDPNSGGRRPVVEEPKRLYLSFPPRQVKSLLTINPAKALYGAAKIIRPSDPNKDYSEKFRPSKDYWAQFHRGVQIDIKSKDEDIFGKPTTIISALTKSIAKLTRKNLAGIMPSHQLKLPIRQLRQSLVDTYEAARKKFRPWEPDNLSVKLSSKVRLIKFKSFRQLYREEHGNYPVSEPAPQQERVPLRIHPEGRLKSVSLYLPRAIFLDTDDFAGPLSPALISDLNKLQMLGVHVVAFSRKPYAAKGAMRDQLNGSMASFRLMTVTDNGAMISRPVNGNGGSVAALDAAPFSATELSVLRHAAQSAAEEAGVPLKSMREKRQPALNENDDSMGFGDKSTPHQRDPHLRFELILPKTLPAQVTDAWRADFLRRLSAHGFAFDVQVQAQDNGVHVRVQKTDLGGSMGRVYKALGEEFDLYLNPTDIVVFSNDPKLKAVNPAMDAAQLTGLQGAELVENVAGLMLGDHREDLKGDIMGSASKMASYAYNRDRFLSDFLMRKKDFDTIFTLAGHVVHAVNGWLIWNLRNGRRPSEAEFEALLATKWEKGLRKLKEIKLSEGGSLDGWRSSSAQIARGMYRMIIAAQDRGEILVGSEIPNFFMIKTFQKRSGNLKRRFGIRAVFDFITLRPDPKNPGHATLMIYDFKTGPAQSRNHLDKDIQVRTYSLFANQKWKGQEFPVPYLSGDQNVVIDEARVEYMYGAIQQPTLITDWGLDKTRNKIISTLTRIHDSEQQLLNGKPKAKSAKKNKTTAKVQDRKIKKKRSA